MKRIVSLFLLLAMLVLPVLALVGCPSGGPGGGGEGGEVGEKTFIDNLGDRNYNDDDFVVSVLNTYEHEVYAEEDSTDVLREAVYKRNRAIEDRFNVNIVPDVTLETGDHTAHISHMQNCFNDGSDSFDVGMLYVYKAGILVMDGMLYEQREWLPYVKDALNNGSEWWSKDINSAFTVQGKQYVSVSDWCITAMSMTYAMVFNKQYEDDNNIASSFGAYNSMYDIVRQGNWTIDTLRTMVKDIGEQLDEDETMELDTDFFGFLCDQSTALDQFAPAFNINYITNNGEMTPELFTVDTRVERGFTALYDLFYGPGDGAFCFNKPNEIVTAFTAGRAFIACLPMERFTEEAFHNMEDDYGLLPYVKLDTNQKEYYSGTVDNYSVICILAVHGLEHLEFIGTMVEALSAETHNSVEQPYYDLIVTHNSTRDEESIEMIEIIMKGRLYDLATLHYARIYYTDVTLNAGYNFGLGLMMRHSITYKIPDISAYWVSVRDQIELRLEELIDEYVNMY